MEPAFRHFYDTRISKLEDLMRQTLKATNEIKAKLQGNGPALKKGGRQKKG